MSEVWTESDLLGGAFWIPSELGPLILIQERNLVLDRMMQALVDGSILLVAACQLPGASH